MSDPNKREREIAVRFYCRTWSAAVDEWIESGRKPADERIDDDIIDLADQLADYREELTNGR